MTRNIKKLLIAIIYAVMWLVLVPYAILRYAILELDLVSEEMLTKYEGRRG